MGLREEVRPQAAWSVGNAVEGGTHTLKKKKKSVGKEENHSKCKVGLHC